ncbi:hypothetical protein EW146_g9415 [Bondarzewia mesenterica]|uniref:J domain-containing protein n=1 Tax=Bondarzewia mesenterica TaxID=1095465 RepID=A0A4S4L818_9AGAM|nr:hypothetical protein EW146_g9415 [Bondarzewia mesenterica]
MSNTDEETNPYELLGITMAATDGEIKTAYRQRSLKVHPDRNRGNPDAARQFHNLNQAYELLLDPLRRLALDAKLRVKEHGRLASRIMTPSGVRLSTSWKNASARSRRPSSSGRPRIAR